MAERIFGEIAGVSVGTTFANRQELNRAGVHKPTQAGISGSGEEGADSIVLSGGYEDDEDFGDVIVYTGQGGQDPNTKRHIADQTLTRGNLALAASMQQGFPIRVVRGAAHKGACSPTIGYRYDGLYRVESFWHEVGAAGFIIWRFRLTRQASVAIDASLVIPKFSPGNEAPTRGNASISRIIRDTALSKQIKHLYNFTCQVCSTRLEGPAGPYAEAAHVRPLGSPHDGPDTADNILCLCPNHHYLFDCGAFGVQGDHTLIGIVGRLTVHPKHALKAQHFEYHRGHFGLIDQL